MIVVEVVCCSTVYIPWKYGYLLNSDSCCDLCVFEIKTVTQNPNRDSCLFMFSDKFNFIRQKWMLVKGN